MEMDPEPGTPPGGRWPPCLGCPGMPTGARVVPVAAADEWEGVRFSICVVYPLLVAALIVGATAMLVEMAVGHT
jgi:hypothetical protein